MCWVTEVQFLPPSRLSFYQKYVYPKDGMPQKFFWIRLKSSISHKPSTSESSYYLCSILERVATFCDALCYYSQLLELSSTGKMLVRVCVSSQERKDLKNRSSDFSDFLCEVRGWII